MMQEYYKNNEKNLNILRNRYYEDLWFRGAIYAQKHLHELCKVFAQYFLVGNLSAKEVENYILSTID